MLGLQNGPLKEDAILCYDFDFALIVQSAYFAFACSWLVALLNLPLGNLTKSYPVT